MAYSVKLSSKTYGKAGTELRSKHREEHKTNREQIKAMNPDLSWRQCESRAQALLERTYKQEFRTIFNALARQVGFSTGEMRRQKSIERKERELKLLREKANG